MCCQLASNTIRLKFNRCQRETLLLDLTAGTHLLCISESFLLFLKCMKKNQVIRSHKNTHSRHQLVFPLSLKKSSALIMEQGNWNEPEANQIKFQQSEAQYLRNDKNVLLVIGGGLGFREKWLVASGGHFENLFNSVVYAEHKQFREE